MYWRMKNGILMGIIDCSRDRKIDLNKLKRGLAFSSLGCNLIWLVNSSDVTRTAAGHFGQQPGNKLDPQRVNVLTTFSLNSASLLLIQVLLPHCLLSRRE